MWGNWKGLKLYIHTKKCTQMFTAALCVIVKKQKQPKRPSAGEWINKMCSAHVVRSLSTIKGMNLEDTVLSEKKPDTKGHILNDFISTKYLEWASLQR